MSPKFSLPLTILRGPWQSYLKRLLSKTSKKTRSKCSGARNVKYLKEHSQPRWPEILIALPFRDVVHSLTMTVSGVERAVFFMRPVRKAFVDPYG